MTFPTKLIIAGGREFDDYPTLVHETKKFIEELNLEVTTIVSGTARGADKLGEQFAMEFGFPIEAHPAEWNKHGKSAGYIRNSEMADSADALIAFWDNKSRGTKHMITTAAKKGLHVKVVYYDKE